MDLYTNEIGGIEFFEFQDGIIRVEDVMLIRELPDDGTIMVTTTNGDECDFVPLEDVEDEEDEEPDDCENEMEVPEALGGGTVRLTNVAVERLSAELMEEEVESLELENADLVKANRTLGEIVADLKAEMGRLKVENTNLLAQNMTFASENQKLKSGSVRTAGDSVIISQKEYIALRNEAENWRTALRRSEHSS